MNQLNKILEGKRKDFYHKAIETLQFRTKRPPWAKYKVTNWDEIWSFISTLAHEVDKEAYYRGYKACEECNELEEESNR